MILEEGSLNGRIVNEGLLTPEDMNTCLELEKYCLSLGVDLPFSNIVLEKFGARAGLWEKLLWIYLSAENEPDAWKEGLVPWVLPENEASFMDRVRREFSITNEDVNIPRDMAYGLEKIGITLNTPEILIARGRVQWEKIRQFVKPGGSSLKKSLKILFSASGETSAPGEMRLEFMAIRSGLVTEREIIRCSSIQNEFASEGGFVIPLELLMHEVLLVDRSHISTLLQNIGRVKYDTEMDRLEHRRLTPEGDRMLAQALREKKWVATDKVMEARTLQGTLHEKSGLSLSLAEILVLQKNLSDDQILSLSLPYQPSDDTVNRVIVCHQGKRSLGDIALANKIVTPKELAKCLVTQERCVEEYGIKMRLGEILLAKGHLNLATLKALLMTQEYIKVRSQLEFQLVHFSSDENILILDRLNAQGRLTPALLGECMNLQKRLFKHDINWSISKLLFLKGIIKQQEIADILASRRNAPKDEHLRFPGWIWHTDRENLLAHLAVANGYITPEEEAECLRIQKHCETVWKLSLPLHFIMFKKGYISIPALNGLIRGERAFSLNKKWNYEIQSLDINKGDEDRLLARLNRYGYLNPESIKECESIQVDLKSKGLELSRIKILLYRKKLSEWGMKASVQEHAYKSEYQLPISIPRPDDFRKPVYPSKFTPAKWKETIVSHTLFGQIAVEEGYITRENLDIALRIQRCFKEQGLLLKIGELLVYMKWLPSTAIKPILTLQAKDLSQLVWPDTDSLSEDDLWTKNLLLEKRLVPKTEVERCLYILDKLKKVGIRKSLHQIILAREILEPEITDNIYKELMNRRKAAAQKTTIDIEEERLEASLSTAMEGRKEEFVLETADEVFTSPTPSVVEHETRQEVFPDMDAVFKSLPLEPIEQAGKFAVQEAFQSEQAYMNESVGDTESVLMSLNDGSELLLDFGNESIQEGEVLQPGEAVSEEMSQLLNQADVRNFEVQVYEDVPQDSEPLLVEPETLMSEKEIHQPYVKSPEEPVQASWGLIHLDEEGIDNGEPVLSQGSEPLLVESEEGIDNGEPVLSQDSDPLLVASVVPEEIDATSPASPYVQELPPIPSMEEPMTIADKASQLLKELGLNLDGKDVGKIQPLVAMRNNEFKKDTGKKEGQHG